MHVQRAAYHLDRDDQDLLAHRNEAILAHPRTGQEQWIEAE